MKSTLDENRYYLECSCGCGDMLHFELHNDATEDKPQYTIDVGIITGWKVPWYRRIWYSLKYIFRLDYIYWANRLIIDHRSIKDLEEIVEKIKINKNSPAIIKRPTAITIKK